jgi:hypothetical protein
MFCTTIISGIVYLIRIEVLGANNQTVAYDKAVAEAKALL